MGIVLFRIGSLARLFVRKQGSWFWTLGVSRKDQYVKTIEELLPGHGI